MWAFGTSCHTGMWANIMQETSKIRMWAYKTCFSIEKQNF